MAARYVSFSLSTGRYCVPVDLVVQIVRLESLIEIPKPPPYVEGVINIRGDIIPVVNLRTRLEIAVDGPVPDARKRRVVVTRMGARLYGLDVDEVREIVEIPADGITRDATSLLGANADFLLGIARREQGIYMVLDLPRVLGVSRDVPGAG